MTANKDLKQAEGNNANHLLVKRVFDNPILKTYGQDKIYDRIRHNLINVKERTNLSHNRFFKVELKSIQRLLMHYQ